MLALPPPMFSTTWRTPDNLTPPNLQQDCNDLYQEFEANSYNSVLDFHTYNQIQHDFAPGNSISTSSEGGVNENSSDHVKVAKNLNHNASERDRRKRVNELYAFLRSLLPMSTDQKKKVSIPQTVSRALKYIPELQKEVGALTRKKEKLSSYSSSSSASTNQDHLSLKKQSTKDAFTIRKSSVVSSVSALSEKEVVVQLMFSTKNMSKNKDIGCLSKVLEYLEQDEDMCVLNSTTFIGSGEGMSINTLHLQVQGDKIFDAERLKEKLYYFYQQS